MDSEKGISQIILRNYKNKALVHWFSCVQAFDLGSTSNGRASSKNGFFPTIVERNQPPINRRQPTKSYSYLQRARGSKEKYERRTGVLRLHDYAGLHQS